MSKLKVMQVITDSNFGGAGKYLFQICKYINKTKFDVIIVVPKGSILTVYLGKINNTKIVETEGIDTKSFSLIGVKELYSLMRKLKPDIIHSHACLSARVAAKLSRISKVVYTRHSLVPESVGIGKFFKMALNRAIPGKVIAVSNAVYNNLISEGERKKNIYLIYNGIEPPKWHYDRKELRKKYNLLNDDIIITLVGRLEEVKGQEHLLKIAQILREKTNHFKIIFAGEGSKRIILEKEAKEKDLPVIFFGHVNSIEEVYSMSDIIVNTSNSEALSYAALEGFSHRKPVVAFDIDGINEVITNGVDGYLVDFGDYKVFAERLFNLIEDEKLRITFGQNGYKKVKLLFSIEKMMEKIENIYGGI